MTYERFIGKARVSFAAANEGTFIRLTPSGCVPDPDGCRDRYVGKVHKKTEDCIIMEWNNPGNNGPPQGTPVEQMKEWWDGPARPEGGLMNKDEQDQFALRSFLCHTLSLGPDWMGNAASHGLDPNDRNYQYLTKNEEYHVMRQEMRITTIPLGAPSPDQIIEKLQSEYKRMRERTVDVEFEAQAGTVPWMGPTLKHKPTRHTAESMKLTPR